MTRALRRRYGRATYTPIEWSKHRDSYNGRVRGLHVFMIDPGVDAWLLWHMDRRGFQSRLIGRYDTLEAAKDAAEKAR